jgi:hypothetical protein
MSRVAPWPLPHFSRLYGERKRRFDGQGKGI